MGHFFEQLAGHSHPRAGLGISRMLVLGSVDWFLGDDQTLNLS